MKPDEIAFNDFPSAVSVKEFEAVLGLCKLQYKRVEDLVEKREQFLQNTKERFNQAQESIDNESVKRGMNKLVYALVRKADKELVKMASEELDTIHEITEFLTRFSPSGAYPQLDLSFVNEYKKLEE